MLQLLESNTIVCAENTQRTLTSQAERISRRAIAIFHFDEVTRFQHLSISHAVFLLLIGMWERNVKRIQQERCVIGFCFFTERNTYKVDTGTLQRTEALC